MPRPPEIPQLTEDGAAIVPLTKGKFAIVDVADYRRICMFSWHTWRSPAKSHAKWYPATSVSIGQRKPLWLTMPTVLLGRRRDMEIDHIDGDSLNNRRSNLRFVTHEQNMLNTVKPRRKNPSPTGSRFKGVAFESRGRKKKPWRAQLRYRGVHYHLGMHATELGAALAYDKKARELFGEFARPNLPEVNPSA